MNLLRAIASALFDYQNLLRRFLPHDDAWVDELVVAVGQELGLSLVKSMFLRSWLRGKVGASTVVVEAWTIVRSGEHLELKVRVEVSLPGPRGFGRRTVFSRATEATGDSMFDDQVVVTGADPWLSQPTRLAIERMVQQGGEMRAGRLVAEVSGPELMGPHEVQQVVRDAIDAVRRLAADPGSAEVLARTDPVVSVRVQALRFLLRGAPPADLLESLVADPTPEVAVVAALAAGEGGHARLRELLDTAVAADALVGLAPRLLPGDPAVERALLQVLAAEPPPEVLRLAGQVGSIALVAPLARLTGPGRDAARSAIRAIQARAVGERGGVSVADAVGGEVSEASPGGAGSVSPS